jgi:hypothetical protein
LSPVALDAQGLSTSEQLLELGFSPRAIAFVVGCCESAGELRAVTHRLGRFAATGDT